MKKKKNESCAPRPECAKCHEWIEDDETDIPHCVHDYNFDCEMFQWGMANTCPKMNIW